MKLKNCVKCGKLFSPQAGEKVCPVCRKEEENEFEMVKEYLWDNPKATIEEVHEETGVERDTIMKFVKEDRLIAEGIDVDWENECERCGKPISHGKYCLECQQELINGFNDKSSEEKKKEIDIKKKGKMYTADRLQKKDDN
ncbi:MAG: flagellar protein [Halanaerobiales bacterium]